ncbi:unnamed protein product [Arabis nemorensis]|uniref:Uncharacterized protein n=1 Tax=Arabis nemorensis TaxID=586526 RepID=A0A565ATM8_9BRAS|nr:unnamed protein product [Arabis nemorensis]
MARKVVGIGRYLRILRCEHKSVLSLSDADYEKMRSDNPRQRRLLPVTSCPRPMRLEMSPWQSKTADNKTKR